MKSAWLPANKQIQPYSDMMVHPWRFGVLLVSVGAMVVMRALAVKSIPVANVRYGFMFIP